MFENRFDQFTTAELVAITKGIEMAAIIYGLPKRDLVEWAKKPAESVTELITELKEELQKRDLKEFNPPEEDGFGSTVMGSLEEIEKKVDSK